MGEVVEEGGHSITAKEVLPLDVVYLLFVYYYYIAGHLVSMSNMSFTQVDMEHTVTAAVDTVSIYFTH